MCIKEPQFEIEHLLFGCFLYAFRILDYTDALEVAIYELAALIESIGIWQNKKMLSTIQLENKGGNVNH